MEPTLRFQPYHGIGKPLTKADYSYEITSDKIVVIEDLDRGDMSVSNDAANVLADIARQEGLPSLAGHRVIYLDSLKNWDEIRLHPDGRFHDFQTLGGKTATETEALAKLRAKQ